jgi:glycosyltransferase involved in cell wall biosynthesis
MKIAINMVAPSLGSGTKTYNINFCNEIVKKRRIRNDLYIYICKNYLKFIDKKIFKHSKIKLIIKSDLLSNSFFRLIWMQLIFPFEIKLKRVDALFSPMNIAPLSICMFNIKSILALHSNLPWRFFHLMPGNNLKKLLIKKMMQYSILCCDKLIVDSNYAKNEITKILNINTQKVKVIYLGLDNQFYEKKNQFFLKNFLYQEPYILSVLSCVKYHNIINIIKAFDLVIKLYKSKISLILVMQILDQEYFNEIKEYILKNNLSNKIKIFIKLDNLYLINLYKNATFYIFSSYSEVFGYTTIEAMKCGCPVLVSRRSALPEINGNAAKYFDPDNINSLKKKILVLLREKKLRKELSSKGLIHAKKFNNKKTFTEIFNEINACN